MTVSGTSAVVAPPDPPPGPETPAGHGRTRAAGRWWWPAALVAVPVLAALVGPWAAPHDPLATSTDVLAGPNADHLLGTDHLGRDVLSRVLHGGRGLVGVALASLVVAEVIGVGLGLLAGHARRAGRSVVLGATEIMLAIPSLLLLSALVAGFGRSWMLLFAASTAVMVPTLVPLVATRTTMLAQQPWMHAAMLAGERRSALLVRELLPNLRPVVAADAGIRLLTAIFMVSTAGYLGFGPEPPAPDWGLMIHEARDTMSRQPWPVAVPAALIACFALGANVAAQRIVGGKAGGQAGHNATRARGSTGVRRSVSRRGTETNAVGAARVTRPAAVGTMWSGTPLPETIALNGSAGALGPAGTAEAQAGPSRIEAGAAQRNARTSTPTSPLPPHDVLVVVRDLTVTGPAGRVILDGVSLNLDAGASVALTGPSGAGKSTLGLALLGHLRDGLSLVHGSVEVLGTDVLRAPSATVRALRRTAVRHVPQDPAAALTPTMRVRDLLAEALGGRDAEGARALLELVRLPSTPEFRRRRPHQLSGGQRRRLALGMALAGDPRLVVFDEPTNGMDAGTRDEVLGELERLRMHAGCAFVVITHDPVVAARLGDREITIRAGRAKEHEEVAGGTDVLRDASASHTRGSEQESANPPMPTSDASRGPAPRRPRLRRGPNGRSPDGVPVLRVDELIAAHGRSRVLNDVSLDLRAGECVALLGASGTGKTTFAHTVAGLHPRSSGSVRLGHDLLAPAAVDRPAALRRRIALVFQDPYTSLNPAHTVGSLIGRPATLRGDDPGPLVATLLREMRLSPDCAARRPAQLSGGERQRVALARALAARPDVLLCDEVTAALDPQHSAEILDLLDEARARHGVAVLLVTHDLDAVRRLADRVVVLDGGRVVEQGSCEGLFAAPRHAVTRRLLGLPAQRPD